MHAQILQGNRDVVPQLRLYRPHVREGELLLMKVVVQWPVPLPLYHAR